MNFAELARVWKTLPMVDRQRSLLAAQWFEACRDWVKGGPSPDDIEDFDNMVKSFWPWHRAVAQAHVECARLARGGQYTSFTVASDELRAVKHRLSSPVCPPLPLAFLHHLATELMREAFAPFVPEEPEPRFRQTVLFPLVNDDNSDGVLAQFVLERFGDGPGEVFLDRRQAFLLDDEFSAIIRYAPAVLHQQRLCSPSGYVRVRIERFRTGQLMTQPLTGSSGGGALAIGLWSAWTETPLEAGLVTSFALTCRLTKGAPAEPDGNCHRVGGLPRKVHQVAQEKPGDRSFLVAREQENELTASDLARHAGVIPRPAATVEEAIEIASGRLGEVLRYLDTLIAEVNRVPPYYRGVAMERLRVRL